MNVLIPQKSPQPQGCPLLPPIQTMLFPSLIIYIQAMNYMWFYLPQAPLPVPQKTTPQNNNNQSEPQAQNIKPEPNLAKKTKRTSKVEQLEKKLVLTRQDLLKAGYEAPTKVWTEEEDSLLIHLRRKEKLDWEQIAKRIPNRNSQMCYHRYQRILFPSREQWKHSDDQLLLRLVDEFGEDWKQISLHIQKWNHRQIKDRYHSHLKPGIKRQPWTIEEDMQLMQLLNEYGKDWQQAQQRFPGRSLLHIKNRYKGRLRVLNDRKLKEMESMKEQHQQQ